MTGNEDEPGMPEPRAWTRYLPLALLLLGTAAFFAFGLHRQISCTSLEAHRDGLADFIAVHEVTAAILYMGVYAAAVAFSLPIGVVLTLAGGFLFGLWAGTAYVVIAATVGATALFLAARSAMGQGLRGRAGAAVARMEQGFRDHALSYLLFLRLMPLFPFWLVNLVPAVVGIPVRTFVIATFFGIIPATFIYVSVGNGVSVLFDIDGSCDVRALMKAEVVLPLLGLAVLALVPVFYKKLRGRTGERKAHE